MIVPFIGFAPDIDPTTPGVITACSNMIPTLRGYGGAPSGIDAGMSALATAALSGALLRKLDGANRVIVGTATKLYEKSGASWTDVSRTAAYNASASARWQFAQFGNTSLAVNKGDVIQSSTSGAFADLTAPKAKLITVVGDFVIIADTNEATYGNSPDRWWCSALLNVTDWVPNIATQCTTGRLVRTPGAITGLKPLADSVIVYKPRSMYIGRYAGPPVVWDFDVASTEIGCAASGAVADVGTAHVFIGENDLYIYDGTLPRPIGAPIREWFFADLDPDYSYLIQNTNDWAEGIVYFFYPRVGSEGALNGCIVYNYKTDKWGVAHRNIECVLDQVNGGFTWDSLPVTGMTWDDWPNVSYDSPYWTSASVVSSYIGTNHKLYSLTGASTSSSLTTGSYGEENNYSLLSRVTPKYLKRPASSTMTNFYSEKLGDPLVEGETTTETSGRFDVLWSAPWHRVKFNFTGDVEITGAGADFEADGVL